MDVKMECPLSGQQSRRATTPSTPAVSSNGWTSRWSVLCQASSHAVQPHLPPRLSRAMDGRQDGVSFVRPAVTPCNHTFHPGCLEQWTDVKMECPLSGQQSRRATTPSTPAVSSNGWTSRWSVLLVEGYFLQFPDILSNDGDDPKLERLLRDVFVFWFLRSLLVFNEKIALVL